MNALVRLELLLTFVFRVALLHVNTQDTQVCSSKVGAPVIDHLISY